VDICRAADSRLGTDLLSRYRRRTLPCIVEFAVRSEHVDRALAAAAWYVEASQRGERSTYASWGGHDCSGIAVPPEAVVSVTVVDHP
jgi:hypothetical protein